MKGEAKLIVHETSNAGTSNEPTVFSLEIKDAEHQAILRLQQEEVIQELRNLVGAYESLAAAVELNAKMTEIGLRMVCLVPITIAFLTVGSYFFYIGKLSETFFGTLLFVLMLPFLGQWIERAFTMLPVLGDILRPRGVKEEPKDPRKP